MNELEILKKQIIDLLDWKKSLESSYTIPLNVDQALVGRKFLKTSNSSGSLPVSAGGTGATTLTGVLVGNGTSAITATAGLSGTKIYYVADSSGGTVTRKLTFVGGILTAET